LCREKSLCGCFRFACEFGPRPCGGHADGAAADDADKALAKGNSRGVLHGVPLAHKDMYYDAGKVVTCGSLIRRDFVPTSTSTATVSPASPASRADRRGESVCGAAVAAPQKCR